MFHFLLSFRDLYKNKNLNINDIELNIKNLSFGTHN